MKKLPIGPFSQIRSHIMRIHVELKKNMNLNILFHFYFFTKYFSLNITLPILKLYRYCLNIVIKGIVSQNFY